ncbi:MAG TPA: ribonuclease H-like domain-containing protein, partial [Vicinamibacterales bacterium]
MSSLADRVRGIVGSGPAPVPAVTDSAGAATRRQIEDAWGGESRDGCYIVQRRWDASEIHGREAIGTFAERLHAASAEAPIFARGAPARPPFIFIDLETTGLNGGAGTHAFLVGSAWFEDDRFVTRQYVMARHADERKMLETVARECARAGAFVSFNGKSFDAPMLETRYLFHRLDWFGGDKPHVDLLHPARQFWKREDCSLQALERQMVGYRRRGDIAGFDVPGRYFQFVRSGDPAPICQVLEHNRLDLLTLAALTSRLFDLARRGPEAARDSREALALGHVFVRAGLELSAR